MNASPRGTALITGASAGIGAIYADRLASRGYDLILVARNRGPLDELAARLAAESGRTIQVVAANLNDKTDVARIESLLGTNQRISVLVNNAGAAAITPLLSSDVNTMEAMIWLNVTVLTRLTHAALPGFVARGGGTIINIASVVALTPETVNCVYGGTKAFVLAFSQSLHSELAKQHIRVQAVLPGTTDTNLLAKLGLSVDQLPQGIVMRAGDMVDAALAGLDQGEVVTIPSLPDSADWQAYEAARQKLMPGLSRQTPAARYGIELGADAKGKLG